METKAEISTIIIPVTGISGFVAGIDNPRPRELDIIVKITGD